MKFVILNSLFILLAAAGLVALARWLHPATFSQGTMWLVLVGVFIAASLLLYKNNANI